MLECGRKDLRGVGEFVGGTSSINPRPLVLSRNVRGRIKDVNTQYLIVSYYEASKNILKMLREYENWTSEHSHITT
jgi:hypothetical protein